MAAEAGSLLTGFNAEKAKSTDKAKSEADKAKPEADKAAMPANKPPMTLEQLSEAILNLPGEIEKKYIKDYITKAAKAISEAFFQKIVFPVVKQGDLSHGNLGFSSYDRQEIAQFNILMGQAQEFMDEKMYEELNGRYGLTAGPFVKKCVEMTRATQNLDDPNEIMKTLKETLGKFLASTYSMDIETVMKTFKPFEAIFKFATEAATAVRPSL